MQVFTGINESVLDPFAGSFTTTIESFRQKRNSIGIELNRTMFRDAVLTRFSNTLGMRPKEVGGDKYDAFEDFHNNFDCLEELIEGDEWK